MLLGAMWEAGAELAPDTVSYNAVLKACGSARQIATAMQVSHRKTSSCCPDQICMSVESCIPVLCMLPSCRLGRKLVDAE